MPRQCSLRNEIAALALVGVALGLAGCGVKGPLRPAPRTPAAIAPAPAAPAGSSAAPAAPNAAPATPNPKP